MTKKQITIKNVIIEVTNNGHIFQDGEELAHHFNKRTGYYTVGIRGIKAPQYVHRLVCIAFHGEPVGDKNFVDHKDACRFNNISSNLRWVTRKSNNNMKHAKIKTHYDIIAKTGKIVATKGDEKIIANTQTQLAKLIGCSHVAIHYALNPNHYSKTVKGYTISYL